MSVFRGKYVVMDTSGLELTQDLEDALWVLDHECKHGFGGTWEIFETGIEDFPWKASFVDHATDEIYFDVEENRWHELYDEDEDEDEGEREDD